MNSSFAKFMNSKFMGMVYALIMFFFCMHLAYRSGEMYGVLFRLYALRENERFVFEAPGTGLPYPRTTPRIKYLMKRLCEKAAYRSLRPTACATSWLPILKTRAGRKRCLDT